MVHCKWALSACILAAIFLASSCQSVYQTALVIASDDNTAAQATSILQGYGAPYVLLAVPQAGISLPSLESTSIESSIGNFGLIIIIGQVSYNYGGSIGYASALTSAQLDALYAYQTKYNIRMIQLGVYPTAIDGMDVIAGGCCSDEQYVRLTNTSIVPTAGLKIANLSTLNMYHYPAKVTNSSGITPFLTFAANSEFASESIGGVIKVYSTGREEMSFFISGGAWSLTSQYLAHIWFTWGYRGLYGGYRRVHFSTQGRHLMFSDFS
jgi:hypothetical protein